MDNDKHASGQEENPVISIIQGIKDGAINPKTLSEEARQGCVDFLVLEGYKEEQIAQILMRSERTIRRDIAAIRKRNSLTPDVSLAKEIIGDMFRKAMVHHKYLMRLARSSESSIAEKGQSEFLAWRILKEMVEKMQTVGYLPTKPQQIIADISHHGGGDGEMSFGELKAQIEEIEAIARNSGELLPETAKELEELKKRIEKAEIATEIETKTAEISAKQTKGEEKDEKHN